MPLFIFSFGWAFKGFCRSKCDINRGKRRAAKREVNWRRERRRGYKGRKAGGERKGRGGGGVGERKLRETRTKVEKSRKLLLLRPRLPTRRGLGRGRLTRSQNGRNVLLVRGHSPRLRKEELCRPTRDRVDRVLVASGDHELAADSHGERRSMDLDVDGTFDNVEQLLGTKDQFG